MEGALEFILIKAAGAVTDAGGGEIVFSSESRREMRTQSSNHVNENYVEVCKFLQKPKENTGGLV